jgi:hypothetical protein
MGGESPMRLIPNRAAVVRGEFKRVQFVVGDPRVS